MESMQLIWPAEITAQRFEAMWRIYVEAIPAAERKPDWMIRGMWEREDYRFGLAEVGKEQLEKRGVGASPMHDLEHGRGAHATRTESANRIVGFSILFVGEIPSNNLTDFYLLEYFAIDARYRGRGIGSELFRQTIEAAKKQCGAAPVLIEVESDAVGSAEQQAVCRKRIEFYRRLECRRILGLEYLLPLKWPVPAMALMVRTNEDSVSAETLRGWLGTIYSKVYRRETDDPRIEQMLGGGGETFRLE